MPIVKITGQGLSAIALSVALLWACWMQERAVTRQSGAERVRVLRDLRNLQRVAPKPASVPVPNTPATLRTAAG